MEDKQKLSAHVRTLFEESIALKRQVVERHVDTILRIGIACADAIERGNKILFCGNGGSAADAQHLAAELTIRLRPNKNRQALPGIALASDYSTLTACGNDYGFDDVFARLVQALGHKGDVLIGITTSGRSKNVIKAFQAAKEKGITAIGFLGNRGASALEACDFAFVLESDTVGRVQESHITAGHAILEIVEEVLEARGKLLLR